MEFSRPEYSSGQPFPSPGDLLNPGIKPRSPALQADSLPANRFLKKQVRWSWIPISKNFPQFTMIHRVKGFSIVNEEK